MARLVFWFVVLGAKFLVAVVLFRAVFELRFGFTSHSFQPARIIDLHLEPLGQATSQDIQIAWYSTVWSRDLLIWLWLWFSALFIFFADTQLWFTVGCSLLGVAVALAQRGCRAVDFALSDAVHHVPERFQRKVLRYTLGQKRSFAKTWNLIIQHMTREHKINARDSGELSYDYLMSEVGVRCTCDVTQEPEPPVLFNKENCLERAAELHVMSLGMELRPASTTATCLTPGSGPQTRSCSGASWPYLEAGGRMDGIDGQV